MLFVNLISMKFKIEETNEIHKKNKKLYADNYNYCINGVII